MMKPSLEFRMNLRFWSSTVSLKSLAEDFAPDVYRCYDIGEIMRSESPRAGSLRARANYLSLNDIETHDPAAISELARRFIRRVEGNAFANALLEDRSLEVVLWIAIIGENELDAADIAIDRDLIGGRVKIFIENYTSLDEQGVPRKLHL